MDPLRLIRQNEVSGNLLNHYPIKPFRAVYRSLSSLGPDKDVFLVEQKVAVEKFDLEALRAW